MYSVLALRRQALGASWSLPDFPAQVTADTAFIFPGHHGAMNQQHMMPSQAFQMRRSLPPDDIQDDFDWDSIV